MLKEYLNELKQRMCLIAPSSFPLGDGGVETEAGEVQRAGAVIRNCGVQLFWEHDSRRSFPLWKPYLGRHCHRRRQLTE